MKIAPRLQMLCLSDPHDLARDKDRLADDWDGQAEELRALLAVARAARRYFDPEHDDCGSLELVYITRSALARLEKVRYLKVSLAFVLMVIGVKMMTHGWLKGWLGSHFNFYVLGVVGSIIAAGVIASLVARRQDSNTSSRAASRIARTAG